jgi:hypothetical protein
MPEFELIPLAEAKMLAAIDRQQRIMNDLYPLVREVETHPGMAGRLRAVGDEDPQKIRNQLYVVAKALGIPLTIRRRQDIVCFWFAEKQESSSPQQQQRRQRRGGTPPMGEELQE